MGTAEEFLLAAAFYTGLGLVALWYVRRIAHPARKLWVAWFQFVGIIVGTVAGVLIVLVALVTSTGITGGAIGRVATTIVVIGVLIPTWRYAKTVIQRPIWKGEPRKPLKEYSLESAPISGLEKFGRFIVFLIVHIPLVALNMWPLFVGGYVLASNDISVAWSVLFWFLWAYPFYHILKPLDRWGWSDLLDRIFPWK